MKKIYTTLLRFMFLLTPALASHTLNDDFKKALEEENTTRIHELLAFDKIDVNLRGKNGFTALILAINQENISTIQTLLKRKDIDINKQGMYTLTPLMVAIMKKNQEIIDLLLDHDDMNINLEGTYGNTALILTIKTKNMVLAERLLKHKSINLNLRNQYGYTPLMLTIIENDIIFFVRLLKRKDIDINIQSRAEKYTAFMLAMAKNHISLAEELLKRDDMDVNLKDKHGNSALMLTIRGNHIALTDKLLNYKNIDINLQNNAGSTALMLAMNIKNITLVEQLLNRHDINVNIKDSNNKTALAHIENKHIDPDQLQADNLYYVSLVKRTHLPSLNKNHVLLQTNYLHTLYTQHASTPMMQQYIDILLVNKLSGELKEKQRSLLYQGCLVAYDSKNSDYSIQAKGIERYKKPSHYQPLLDEDLTNLLAGYLRSVDMRGVSNRSDWTHFIKCYLWSNNQFALEQNVTNMNLKKIHIWCKHNSPYTEFLYIANRTQNRALFKVIAQQGQYEAVATKYLARGLQQKNIIPREEQVFEKSITQLTPIIVAGLNALAHQLTASS